ncbi:MAG: ribbon-helix-helix domain-containing protein, partial [Pseudomonadota bacterium]
PNQTSTIAVRLPEDIASELEEISRETGRSKSYYVREAITKYLEDRADYLDAVRVLEKSKGKKRIPFEQIKRELGLDD